MKKIILIIIVFLIGCGVWYFMMLKKNANEAVVNQPEENVSQSSVYSASINEETYTQVNYPDPLTKAITEPDEQGNVFLAEEKLFMIQYFTKDKVFNITLLGANLLESRVAAQNKLLEILDITQEDACKIKTYTGAPFGLSQEMAGTNLGLSFCPGSVDLSSYTEKK